MNFIKKRAVPLWYSPAFMLALFVFSFAAVIWIADLNAEKTRHDEIVNQAESLGTSIRLRLKGNEDYLSMLAKSRADRSLNAESFQQRASTYASEHPEIINITWVDADYFIRDVAPLAANRQIIGLHLDLPEPKRVSRLARETRQPAYTRPFEAIQGKPSFEVWVPVFEGEHFLGLFAGVYSCEKALNSLVPRQVLQSYQAKMVDATGRVLSEAAHSGPVDEKLAHKALLTPQDSGVFLQLGSYGAGRLGWVLQLLELLCLALVLAMAYAMWALNREVKARTQTEEELYQKTDLLEKELAERLVTQGALERQTGILEGEIEERARAEASLRESEARYRVLIEQAPDAIAVYDVDQARFVDANGSAEALFGCSNAELLRDGPQHFYLPQQPDALKVEDSFAEHNRQALAGHQVQFERTIRSADGRNLTCVVRLTRLPHEKRRLVRASFTDITGSKTLERDLQRQAIQLGEELAERQAAQEAIQEQTTLLEEEIEERRRMEEALKQSEATVRNKLKAILEPEGDIGTLELSDIIDCEALQAMMEDFYRLTGMLGAVLDVSGKVLVAVGWKDICTKFHRCHPETLRHCIESDTSLTSGVQPGTFKRYHCKNNMWDMVTPVVIGGRHVGNVFIGQFFYDDEVPDVELFREQARKYGFDETEYLAALEQVPRFSREAVDAGMKFYAKLAGMVSSLSFSSIRMSRMLSERTRAREELSRLMREQQVILDNAPIGISLVKGRTQIWVNRKVQELFQYTRPEIEGHSTRKFFRSQQAYDLVRQESEAVLAGGREFLFEQQMVRRDGSLIWIKFTGRAVDPADLSEGIIWLLEDITDLVRSEEQIKLKDFSLSTITDAMYWISIDSKILDVNGAATDMLGYSKEQFLTMAIADIDPEISVEKWQWYWEQLKQKGNLQMEAVHRAVDGRTVPVEIIASYCLYKDLEYTCAIVRDIADRKQLEEQLRQSQKMEAVGLLAGGVAHDFNNILMVIMGYGNMLQRDKELNNRHQEMIDVILSSADKAAQLTHGLLAFSRKQVLAPKVINLNDLTRKVNTFIARIIGEDILLRTTTVGEGLTVFADAGQIEQVLINLATNARDAMPKGGLLTIETGLQLVEASLSRDNEVCAPGRYAVVTVTDTGEGMDEAISQRIFEPFFTTKGVGKGTGLGMAIVYGIIKQHNGFIQVQSEPGRGSTFRVYLPIHAAEGLAPQEEARAALPRGGRETILLAEDDVDVRNLMVTVLAEFGYQVIQAVDGQDAVEKFVAHREEVDIILMDMIMPRKNGKDAFEEISRLAPKVKVLYSSGYTADYIQNRGMSEEGIELVMKPVQPTELLRKVRSLLDSP
jgi:two-component system, cell cycle sensor histidine kinase and response regulator CckA